MLLSLNPNPTDRPSRLTPRRSILRIPQNRDLSRRASCISFNHSSNRDSLLPLNLNKAIRKGSKRKSALSARAVIISLMLRRTSKGGFLSSLLLNLCQQQSPPSTKVVSQCWIRFLNQNLQWKHVLNKSRGIESEEEELLSACIWRMWNSLNFHSKGHQGKT